VPARIFRRPVGLGLAAVLVLAGLVAVAAPSTSRARAAAATRHLEYVFPNKEIDVYDIDRANRLVGRIPLPQAVGVRGVAASPATGMLFVSYGGQGGTAGNGSMLAFDLLRNKVVWQKDYSTGVDSIAVTPNGKTIYLPVGETSGNGTWEIVDARNGDITGSITAGGGAHNTIMSLDGKYVYLAGVDLPYLTVVSTRTNTIVRRIGPLRTGGRPFTINGKQTLAFTTAHTLLGFQVSSITTGKVLQTVPVPGFSWDPKTFTRSPSHGISLTPNEKQLYVIDTPNGYVHVFDVSKVPAQRPVKIADIKLAHPPPNDGWLQASRDGRYVYVGRAGDVIDTRTLKVAGFLPPLQLTADSLEIDWRGGRPVATTSRYGLGYVTR
jgi:DNA-binding beta-propeller fold protein YncE